MYFLRTLILYNLSTVTKIQKCNIDAVSYSDFTDCPSNVPHSHFFSLCLEFSWASCIPFSFTTFWNLTFLSLSLCFMAVIFLRSINVLFCSVFPIWELFDVIRLSVCVFGENKKSHYYQFRGYLIRVCSIIDEVT